MEYTELEKSVLEWIAQNIEIPNLSIQIRSAKPCSREFTGCGSFTTLAVPANLPALHCKSPIDGPFIESEGIEHGGGALIFLDSAGFIETLEMFANGDHFSQQITDFILRSPESDGTPEHG
ncbi:MAG: hypothetical protein AAGA92_08655 [Planctomycetota bacterium]